MSAEGTVVRNYLDWLLSIPWNKKSKTNKDLVHAQQILDHDHYGLEKVKERIVEYLAVQQRANKLTGPILCLVGPPGVGKTSLGKSIAHASGRDFVRVSLGGVHDEAESAATGAPISAQCRARSSSRCARPRPRFRCSCSTRLTRWAPISAAIRRRLCLRSSTLSKSHL